MRTPTGGTMMDLWNKMEISYDEGTLDLRDVALLLNYERATTEPRFRYTKLQEVVNPGFEFKTILCNEPEWITATVPRTGFVFDRRRPSSDGADELDTLSNILPTPIPPQMQGFTPKALETYYWQARNHDGCYTTALAFQHFIDLFPPGPTKVRVRMVDNTNGAKEYTTLAGSRSIVEMSLFGSKAITLSSVKDHPNGRVYITDSDPSSPHVVLGFSESSLYGEVDTILDMSALQFGDVGRGDNGRSLIVLEPKAQYASRVAKFAHRNNFAHTKHSYRMNDNAPNNEWMLEVARRTKDRWDNRTTTPWCGHCGAPRGGNQLRRCAACKAVHYCDAEHQKAAWSYHKHFCNAS